MLNTRFCHIISHILTCFVIIVAMLNLSVSSYAQTVSQDENIDPRLIKIVEQVKARKPNSLDKGLRGVKPVVNFDTKAARYIDAINQIEISSFSQNPEKIRSDIIVFEQMYVDDGELSLFRIIDLFSEYADMLETGVELVDQQKAVGRYIEQGSWFERYLALSLSRYIHSENQERQAALQKARLAQTLIPNKQIDTAYIEYARAKSTLTIAGLHSLHGNTDLAVLTSLEYLRLTEDSYDYQTEIDLINNLIYSHNISRDHTAAIYLGEQLLEIEEAGTSSIPGLSEFRVAQVLNAAGRFQEGLDYSRLALEKVSHPQITLQAKKEKAVSLAGLGRFYSARKTAGEAGVNLSPEHLLTAETRRSNLYLGFLLAQPDNPDLVAKLYRRQLDVASQKFLENNSRDTTAMLADLENTRERQAEREAAAIREARLQEMTIDRQQKLNRALMVLLVLFGAAAIAAIIFARYRDKMMRELEAKTEQAASAEKLKTQFLGMISHELRTPLNAIIGISDYLTNYHNDPDIRKKSSIILKGGNDLFSVVESLTDMARIDADQMELDPEDNDLAKALNEVPEKWIEAAEAKGLAFTHFIDPIIASHNVDQKRIIQCIDVLMSNAIGFTKAGRVHLHITGTSNDKGTVTGLTAVVADTGRGMSDLVQSRLFTPFMQADASRKRNHMGTGLSLAIAYALAKMMDGDLSVISREGRGSEFKLSVALQPIVNTLPVFVEEALKESGTIEPSVPEKITLETPILETNAAPSRPVIDLMQPRVNFPTLHDVPELNLPTPEEGRYRILVVDDMEPNRDILRLMLESQGHICDEAEGGMEALTRLASTEFDLVILDVHMTPMDGVETLERIRSKASGYSNIPVIALTADNAPSTNAACMEAGADLFLTKPVRRGELLHALKYLRKTVGSRILSQQA